MAVKRISRRPHYRSSRRRSIFKTIFRTGIIIFVIAAGKEISSEILATQVTGKIRVIDGDTIKLDGESIRLVGMDAPELKQNCYTLQQQEWACGQQAKIFLDQLIKNSDIQCKIFGTDKYSRSLGRCYVDETDIALSLISSGYATATGMTYALAEMSARQDKLGIWSGKFQSPSAWRKQNK